ncbi:hypothetical protein SERLA73DRAFT_27649, partial [Serpula lacrymans var. lacrymans S7.3]
CAVFSTFNLPLVHDDATDDRLWMSVRWRHYWERDIWIVPIHRPGLVGHWTAAIIKLKTLKIHHFNSFTD